MPKKNAMHKINPFQIARFAEYLWDQERANATVEKYTRDLTALYQWLGDRALTKSALLQWKEYLSSCYAPASVNSMLAALNSFLHYMGWTELTVKPLRIQQALFYNEERELTREEYVRLINTAKCTGRERLSLVMQTICATGIRVSELRFITVEAVRAGRVEVCNKGKRRTIFLPSKLCCILKKFLKKEKRTAGAVFITRTGRPLDRSNIWREMKALCESAGVQPEKFFPTISAIYSHGPIMGWKRIFRDSLTSWAILASIPHEFIQLKVVKSMLGKWTK